MLATDEWLRVEGCEDIYALGDCATIDQRKVMVCHFSDISSNLWIFTRSDVINGLVNYQEDIAAIFSKADKKNTGKLKADDFNEVINDITERYPQVVIHLKKQQVKNFLQLLKNAQGEDELDIEKFKLALSAVDAQMKNLPATAQVKRETIILRLNGAHLL